MREANTKPLTTSAPFNFVIAYSLVITVVCRYFIELSIVVRKL